MDRAYAVASCHVESPLDDRVWDAFARLQRAAPGGFRIAALMRPPDLDAGEDEERWLARAREAATHGPLGHHTHFGGPTQARPLADARPAERVRRECGWLRAHGLEPRLWCGGGWYVDEEVAATLAELGYADCSATAFRPAYLAEDAKRLSLREPAWLRVRGGRLLELPSTHSLGMAARAALRPLPRALHLYFHDTDLLDARRRRVLVAALRLLGLRRRPTDLDELRRRAAAEAPELDFRLAG